MPTLKPHKTTPAALMMIRFVRSCIDLPPVFAHGMHRHYIFRMKKPD